MGTYLIHFVHSDGDPAVRIVHCTEIEALELRDMVAEMYEDPEARAVEFDCSGDDAEQIRSDFKDMLVWNASKGVFNG